MNLAGLIVPGTRVPAVPGRFVSFLNGVLVEDTPGCTLPANDAPATFVSPASYALSSGVAGLF
jgi:hypothetical protein